MSTKTTFKRIALVAVAALGFGMLSVVPSNADNTVSSKISSIALTADLSTVAVGATSTVTVSPTIAANAAANGDVFNINGFVTAKPAGAVVTLTTTAGSAITGKTLSFASSGSNANLAILLGTQATAATNATGAAIFGTIALTSTVAGSVTLRVFNDGATKDGLVSPGEAFQDITVTVVAASAVAGNQFPNSADPTNGVTGTVSLAGIIVSSVGIVVTQPSGRVGTQIGFQPGYLLKRNGAVGAIADASGPSNASKFATIAYSVTNPAGTAVTVYSAQGGTTASASQAIAGSAAQIALGANNTAAENIVAKSQSVSLQTGYPQIGSTVYFSTATAGTYTITAFDDANQDGLVSVGEATTTSTVTIVADALPSILFTTYGQSTPAQAANTGVGQLVKISIKNGTAVASLGASEVLTITGPTGTVIDNKSSLGASGLLSMVEGGNGVSTTLTQANFDRSGNAYINVGNSTAGGGTYTLTGSIAGGTAAGASGTGSFTVVDTTTYPEAAVSAKFTTNAVTNPYNLLGVKGLTLTAIAANGADANLTWSVKRGVATTVTGKMAVGAMASTTYTATYTDTLGLVTGMAGSIYKMAKSTGATVTALTAVTFSVAVPALTSTQTGMGTLALNVFELTGNVADTQTINISNEAAVATFSYSDTTQAAATYSIRAAVASSNKFTATVTDQFGNTMANVAVTSAIAGRNAATVIPTLITDANGQVSYTLADVYTGTALLTDTLTFTPSAGATSSVTVNYATYLPAATIKMTTPDSATATATGIAGSVKSPISTGDGAEAGAVSVSVVLKDANGATLPAGVLVTFSVAGNTGAAILSTSKVVPTDSSGAASTSVYASLNGNATVTATAGAVTSSGIVYFSQTNDGSSAARTVTATATGNVITAKVTDRFGNPIKGTSLTASRVGTGTFNGTSSITGVTDAAGVVDFVLAGGTAAVTVGFSSTTFGQSAATKGYLDAGITALTAYTAGTVALAETGVGSSNDAAGVNSVTIAGVTDTAAAAAAAAATKAASDAAAATAAAATKAASDAAAAATKAASDAAAAAAKAASDAAAAAAAKAASDAAAAAAKAASDAATAKAASDAATAKAASDAAAVTAAAAAATAAAADIAQAAVDAASEATDAANAATDAANAAAEAADAATAAAQDAADAVAALSVQVASLIADLKAQISAQAAAITALTNLIIKIQKKVKA